MNMKAERKLRLVEAGVENQRTLRIAVATRGHGFVDESFGRTTMFAIYEVAADASRLVELVQFAPIPRKCDAANDNPDDCEHGIEARIAALGTCHLIFARAIGDVAAASVMKGHMHPIKVARDEPIEALLGRCRAMLATNPPPWVRRIIAAAGAPERLNGTESETYVRGGALAAS